MLLRARTLLFPVAVPLLLVPSEPAPLQTAAGAASHWGPTGMGGWHVSHTDPQEPSGSSQLSPSSPSSLVAAAAIS